LFGNVKISFKASKFWSKYSQERRQKNFQGDANGEKQGRKITPLSLPLLYQYHGMNIQKGTASLCRSPCILPVVKRLLETCCLTLFAIVSQGVGRKISRGWGQRKNSTVKPLPGGRGQRIKNRKIAKKTEK